MCYNISRKSVKIISLYRKEKGAIVHTNPNPGLIVMAVVLTVVLFCLAFSNEINCLLLSWTRRIEAWTKRTNDETARIKRERGQEQEHQKRH